MKITYTLSFALLYCSNLFAITVVEPIEIGEQLGWYGSLDGDLSLSKGDTEETEYSTQGMLGWGADRYSLYLLGSYAYAKVNNVVDTDESFTHFRYLRTTPLRHTVFELLYQLGQDEQSFIERRQIYGGGLRYQKNVGQNKKFFFGLGALDEVKNLKGQPRTTEWLINAYLSGKITFANQSSLFVVVYYQPWISKPSTFDSIARAQYKVPLSENFSLKLKVAYRHTETPATGKHRDNSSSVVGFGYEF